MFVRWKKRRSSDKQPAHFWKADELTYSAELVESMRINGKPRQRVIAFLGSIKQSELASTTSRYYFWHQLVTKRMKEDYPLRTLPPEQHRAIFEALQRKVQLSAEDFAVEYDRTRHAIGEWHMPTF